MKRYPNVTLKLLIRKKNKILIFKRNSGSYDFPGGRLEFLESIQDALKREIKEELIYNLTKEPEPFHIWNYISKNKKRHSVMIYFFYETKKIEEFTSAEGHRILWYDKKSMKQVVKDNEFVNRMYA